MKPEISLRGPYLVYLSIASILVGVLVAPLFRDVPVETGTRIQAAIAHDLMHGELEVPTLGAPAISMTVTKDAKAGWNLSLQADNFTFAPDQVNTPHAANTGHAHLYIDGVKTARLYAPHFHIPDLPPGRHEITVNLNSNDHAFYVSGGSRIEARAVVMQGPVTVPGS